MQLQIGNGNGAARRIINVSISQTYIVLDSGRKKEKMHSTKQSSLAVSNNNALDKKSRKNTNICITHRSDMCHGQNRNWPCNDHCIILEVGYYRYSTIPQRRE